MENFNLENRIDEKFFDRDTHEVAKSILGNFLVRKFDDGHYRMGKIVEVEAYQGFEDKASHASRRKTARNEIMFGKAGHYYVYFVYGMYFCLNIVTEGKEFPAAVLIRSIEPIFDSKIDISKFSISEKRKLSAGPGKLCRWLEIDKNFNGKPVSNKSLFIFSDNDISHPRIKNAKRIGIDFAQESASLPWRYYIENNKYLSKG